MNYTCTRDNSISISASKAILAGISPDGGLFLPEEFPKVSLDDISKMRSMTYPERAAYIICLFLTDFTNDELKAYTAAAYSKSRFGEIPAPVIDIGGESILELFHGPTSAFKDFALQLLPYLLTASAKKQGINDKIAILVATSGDTGKAALEGFADVDGTGICVFYPYGGTSEIQRLQMTTQQGKNVLVTAVKGNFDDAQSGVKAIFTDKAYTDELKEMGIRLSSANSINWGRLVPQVAYYFSAYCDMANAGAVKFGDAINIAVPTGNFGNILAAYIAKLCGLPVKRFICASNKNNVLTDFIQSGTYDKNRPFYLTTSPSMDILISSNLERLLYLLSGRNDAEVRGYMAALAKDGKYTVSPGLHRAIAAEFACGFADDAGAAETIRRTFEERRYLADPHTAVAIAVYEAYKRSTGDCTPAVIASTASPFKFSRSVLKALGEDTSGSEFDLIDRLADISGLTIPSRLAGLRDMAERFTGCIEPAGMKSFISKGLIK